MSVQVSVPLSALSDARVAEALNNLLAVLGATSFRFPTPRGAAPAPAPAAPRPDADARYAAFIEALPQRSRDFLALVEARQVLTIDEAMAALEVDVGKAMGGITGSIARWAPEHDVLVPFEAIKGPGGKRAWRWIGFDRRPAPPVPVRGRRRRRAATKSPPANDGAGTVPDRIQALRAAVPESTAEFLGLLESHGTLSQAEVLAHFGLARAQGLSRIISPLGPAAAKHDLGGLVETVVSATGERGWRWGLHSAEPQAARPTAPSVANSESLPGVKVRKRR